MIHICGGDPATSGNGMTWFGTAYISNSMLGLSIYLQKWKKYALPVTLSVKMELLSNKNPALNKACEIGSLDSWRCACWEDIIGLKELEDVQLGYLDVQNILTFRVQCCLTEDNIDSFSSFPLFT
ncbi:hypothetical protein SNE40_006793 [Patella caerulea]|uniref:Uncharacterized protein n=1 Tax=Patella caerulea TaxID=87958 RepID=A0AAN8K1Z0_PATCE